MKPATRLLISAFVVVLAAAALAFLAPAVARADTCTVTSHLDDGTTPGTLRVLLADAACITIDFANDTTIALRSTLTLARNVTIDGAGHQVVITGDTDGNGAGDTRLFQVNNGISAALRNLTLEKGHVSGSGGGIYNMGTLSLANCTIAGSSASYSGGGIYNRGTLSLVNCTLAGNSAAAGANLASSGTAVVKNTILITGTTGSNCSGTLGTGSIKNLADDSSCGDSTVTTVKTAAQINLQTLASNGGLTQTMALGSGSAAIDAGNATACQASKVKNIDQRGYTRFVDGNNNGVKDCDIGAYEYLSSPAAPAPPAPETFPPNTTITLNPTSADGMNGWYRSEPMAKVSAADRSGVIEVRCVLDPAFEPLEYNQLPEGCPYLDSASPVTGDGLHTLYAAAMDLYANQGTPVKLAFQVDATPPEITCPQAEPFFLNSGTHLIGPGGVNASVSGLDETASTLSGIIHTDSVGEKSLTFTAFDLAGNSASKLCTYNVIYAFAGFYPPVLSAPAFNTAEAGSAIPIKFSLAGDQGLNILSAGYPTVQPIDCLTMEPLGSASETKPAGKSGLSYDPLTGWYHYVWKTEKANASTCQVLTIELVDGTSHQAYFKFQ